MVTKNKCNKGPDGSGQHFTVTAPRSSPAFSNKAARSTTLCDQQCRLGADGSLGVDGNFSYFQRQIQGGNPFNMGVMAC